jgi:hypothetical protein
LFTAITLTLSILGIAGRLAAPEFRAEWTKFCTGRPDGELKVIFPRYDIATSD